MAAVDQVWRWPNMMVSSSSGGGSGISSTPTAGMKPVPMKLFSTWEIDKSTPSCIPRLCSLTLTRLVLLKQLEPDLQSLIIAIKMQSSSKRILRSNEISLMSNGLLDTELDLTFSLQYPHFLKGDGNRLQIMLQRRKKYKNRTILGYKTLAAGYINMSQVLQQTADHELHLYSGVKEQSRPIAQVMIISLSSQPVEQEDRRPVPATDVDRSPGEMSDEDEVREYQDFSDDDISDVEALPGDDDRPTRSHKLLQARPTLASRQRNLKQKFAALLRRFKVSDEVLESVQELGDQEASSCYVDDLLDDVETLSESDLDMDTISVRSTPKPKLRPFFAGRGVGNNSPLDFPKAIHHLTLADKCGDDNSSSKTDSDSSNEEEISIPRRSVSLVPRTVNGRNELPRSAVTSRKFSLDLNDRKLLTTSLSLNDDRILQNTVPIGPFDMARALAEQMAAILSTNNSLPECIVMVDTHELHSQMIAHALQTANFRTVCTCSSADVRAVIATVVAKIQKYHSKSVSVSSPMKIAIVGGDSYVSSVLRPYVELFSTKSSDWLTNVRFLIVPFGGSTIGKHLVRMDAKYAALFNDTVWKEMVAEKMESSVRFDVVEIASRIIRYISTASQAVQLPLAEAILTNKEKGADDSSQIIVPFVGEVRLGPTDMTRNSTVPSLSDPEESTGMLSSSPPTSSHLIVNDKVKEAAAVNPANNMNSVQPVTAPGISSGSVPLESSAPSDTVDLQLDYWMVPSRSDASEKSDKLTRKEVKCSLKTMFRSMRVFRMQMNNSGGGVGQGDSAMLPNALTMIVVTREKKQKIMRLKKSKEPDAKKSQQVDGINRLICTSKSQNHPISVSIDGVEWPGVKFFQVSAHWQTHVKWLPVLIFGPSTTVAMMMIDSSGANSGGCASQVPVTG